MIDVRISDDELSKKKQRLSDLEGIIQGEKFTVDDLSFRIEHGYKKGLHMLNKMLEKHKSMLEMYKKERATLREEITCQRDLYSEIMQRYNQIKSIQSAIDEWWNYALDEIEEMIADVKVTAGVEDKVVEIQLSVYAEPVEADIFPYHRKMDKSRPVTTTQQSHKARVKKGCVKHARLEDRIRVDKLKDRNKLLEARKREAAYWENRYKELEVLERRKKARNNRKTK